VGKILTGHTMKTFVKNLFLVVMFFVLLSIVFSLFVQPKTKPEQTIALSEVARKINAGSIKQIAVNDNDLIVTDASGAVWHSQKESETSLTQSLANLGVDKTKLSAVSVQLQTTNAGNSLWLTIAIQVIVPFVLVLGLLWFMSRQTQKGMAQTFNFGRVNLKLFMNPKERITFKDVAGLQEAKEELREVVDFLRHAKKFLDLGARIPRGVLLMGAPGTGKTLLARAVAGEAGVPFFHISGSEFVELFVGVGASRVRDLFAVAKKASPSIVFIDEIDAVGRERGTGLGGGHDEREQTLNQILVEMDGFDRETNVIVIAASVTGDTPVLVKQNEEPKLLPISEVIDAYYQEKEGNVEKSANGLEVLGFEKKPGGDKNIYFQNSAFKKVRSVFRHKVNEIYKIEYNGGKIKTTGNHSLFIRTPRGLKKKLVSEMKPGEILVNLPYKVNQTTKFKEIRAHQFNQEFNLELPVWQPLFEKFESVDFAYQYALARTNEIPQTKLGEQLGFSQRTIGKWQQGICGPRALSRNYYQHKNTLPEKVRVTPGLMRLFGYYAAEGYSRKEIDFCLNINEKGKIAEIKTLMKQIFNLKPDTERNITHNAVNIVYYCKPLAEFFAYYCGRGAHHKHIPSFLFTAPKEYFIEFLRGYANGDGCLVEKGRNKGNLVLVSVSKRLLLELNWLSRMHGFEPSFSEFRNQEGRRINNGKPLKSSIAYRLEFWKTTNPFKNVERKESLHPLSKIKKITKLLYKGYVYDFCGCENEAFFAGEKPILASNTNRPDVLDPALLRPGRFDRRVVLDLPDIKEREEILVLHMKNKKAAQGVDLRRVAQRTPGFAGADLANVVNESAILAARKNKKIIDQIDLFEAMEKVILGPERKSHVLTQREREITAYHEAGHALVSTMLSQADPVHKVSIISRGRVAGYTLKLPNEDRHLYTRKHLLAELAGALGGYMAEKIVFKDVTTGASNDLRIATDSARHMVMEYGMSEKFGPIAFGTSSEWVFLGRDLGSERDYSEKVAQEIDQEVRLLLADAQTQAQKILIAKRPILDAIAKRLIESETIEKEEFETLVRAYARKPKKTGSPNNKTSA